MMGYVSTPLQYLRSGAQSPFTLCLPWKPGLRQNFGPYQAFPHFPLSSATSMSLIHLDRRRLRVCHMRQTCPANSASTRQGQMMLCTKRPCRGCRTDLRRGPLASRSELGPNDFGGIRLAGAPVLHVKNNSGHVVYDLGTASYWKAVSRT
jgi:hypothetical protein